MSMRKNVERAKALKIDRNEKWVIARRTLDVQLEDMGADVHPDVLMCLSSDMELVIGTNVISPDTPDSEILNWALDCMLHPMLGKPRRPAEIMLTGEGLKHLREPLEDIGISISVKTLPIPKLDEFVESLEHSLTSPGIPPYTFKKGVKLDTVADFFQAASEFHQVRPWELFEYEIPIKVELQFKKKVNYWVVVMGTGGEEFGLSLYRSLEDLRGIFDSEDEVAAIETAEQTWALVFSYMNFDEIGAAAQVECLDNEWPVINESLYPSALVINPKKEELADRPTNKELIELTAVTRALTGFFKDNSDEVEDEEFIEETRKVSTIDGDILVSIDFPAPGFYEDEDEEEYDPFANYDVIPKRTPTALDRAQDLIAEAYDEESKNKRIKLAKQAIAISADCAEAYLMLADEAARDDRERLKFLQEAVEAGRRAIGDEFDELTGHFWLALETRPYMRARASLAHFLVMHGEVEQAISHFRDMLRLNPNDSQGVRYALSHALMLAGKDDEVRKLLKEYDDDTNTIWLYNKALMNFKQFGGSKKTNLSLGKAIARNMHVLDYLLERKRLPDDISFSYVLGSDDEASMYAYLFLPVWKSTDGAIEWLKSMFDKEK